MRTDGRTVAEAMAVGTPVVATNVGGPAELIEDGVTGLLAPPGEPTAWSNAIRRIVEDPQREASRYHMRVALQIIGAPSWANGGKPWNWAPHNPRDFANFAIAAARRYPSVHLWMVWVEPSRKYNFEPLIAAKRHPKLFIAEWTVPTAIDLDFNFYVDKPVQAKWIADSLRIGRQLKSIYAIGWIHLFDEPPSSPSGLIETDGVKKPGYYAWKDG